MNQVLPYDPQCEMMAREELEQIQTERLQVTLNRVYRSVAFYRTAFDAHQVDLRKFKDIRALRDLPFTTKEDLQKSYLYNMFAVPLRDIIRIHATSGTTGKPIVVGYTQNDLSNWRQCAARLLAASGVTGSALNIDLYYPANVVRPYLPDAKGIATAIANDLTAIGFTVSLKTEDWHGGYISDSYGGKLPLYLLGWTCDWAGADNFLVAAWFGWSNGKPNAQFDWNNPQANTDMTQALQAPTVDAANALWGQVQDLLAQDLPMVPIVNSQPPRAYTSKVHGYVGDSNGIEYLNTVWLSQ